MSASSVAGEDAFPDYGSVLSDVDDGAVDTSSPLRRPESIDGEDLDPPVLLMPPSMSDHGGGSSLFSPFISSNPDLLSVASDHEHSPMRHYDIPVSERSPLLQKQPSISFRDAPELVNPDGSSVAIRSVRSKLDSRMGRSSESFVSHEHKEVFDPITGNSTFGQSLFNSIAVLLGVGILSEPFAFAGAGWIGGSLITIGFGFVSCYTSKILAKFIHEDPSLRTYADCNRKAFGPRSSVITTALFFGELFTICVLLVVLFSDSLHAIFPAYSTETYKLLSLLILIPTAFLPLWVISYTSLLSVFSTLFIGIVLVVGGLTKHDAPGSLYEPVPTDLWPAGPRELGLSFGIFMAGFSGHAVIPSIARDMQHPEQFDKMINYAFGITTFVYGTMGVCGYLMFGRSVTDEINRDLLLTPGYNVVLTRAGTWMLVISPITKFALSSRPLNIMLEIIFDLEPRVLSISPSYLRKRRRSSSAHTISSGASAGALENGIAAHLEAERVRARSRKAVLFVVERISLVLVAVFVAIAVPQFGIVMSLLGALMAFGICVISPIAAQVAITGQWNKFDLVLLVTAVIMSVWGTGVCVLDQAQGM